MTDSVDNDRVRATYLIETAQDPAKAAEVLAGEQSSGTFVAVPGETAELRERFRARVESVESLGQLPAPSLPGAVIPEGATIQQARVVVSFSLENMGTNLPTLFSTVAGNLFELREFSGLRLLDVDFPQAFAEAYPGPAYGITGTRELCGVTDRPIIGTIVKPSVGLSPEQTGDLVSDLALAGIDFIKDDELMADPPHSPLHRRVEAVMSAIDAAAQKTGKRVMFAFNISDDIEAMRRHYDCVRKAGGSCVMVSLNSVGLPALAHLRTYCDLPIHGHRNGWGMWTRCQALGIAFTAYQKFQRLAGVDHIHVNGLANKFWEPDDSVVQSIRDCLTPMLGGYVAMPVISSGQWGGQAPETYARTQTVDLIYLAGGGMMAHPGGPAAGCLAIRQAWEAAVAGIPLDVFAKDHDELAQSLTTFVSRT